eukprot:3048098-Pleurochrysis_carterae.AAC.1
MLQQMKQLRLDTAAAASAPRPTDSVASDAPVLASVQASAPTSAPGRPPHRVRRLRQTLLLVPQ